MAPFRHWLPSGPWGPPLVPTELERPRERSLPRAGWPAALAGLAWLLVWFCLDSWIWAGFGLISDGFGLAWAGVALIWLGFCTFACFCLDLCLF